MKTTGSIIRELRKEKGINQEELAICLGVTSQAVSKWENDVGLPDISLLVPIADYFNVSLDYLFLRDVRDSYGVEAVSSKETIKKIKELYMRARDLLYVSPDNYRCHLNLADYEYLLAYAENLNDGIPERLDEFAEEALLHYETVIDNAKDDELIERAVIGKILTLRFLERIDEADWSAEFEYPDDSITTADQIMELTDRGRTLKEYLRSETM